MNLISVYEDDKHTHKLFDIFGIKFKIKKELNNKILRNKPFGLIIDTTIICNNCCSFCWRKNFPEHLEKLNKEVPQKTMSFDIFKKIVDDACQYSHITWFSCCGPFGDPMLNPQIEKFYKYAYDKHHFKTLAVNTNGLVLDKKDLGTLLNSIHEFSISVDSVDLDTYEKIHGHRNLEKVIDNIKKCVEYKRTHGALASIVVRFTENDLNRGQIDDFVKFFEKIGIDEIHYAHEHSFAGVKNEYNDKKTVMECPHPNHILNFDFLGNLMTCCVNWHFTPLFGNIKNKTIKQMWESYNKTVWNNFLRFYTTPCNKCSGAGDKIKGEVRSKRIHFQHKECIK